MLLGDPQTSDMRDGERYHVVGLVTRAGDECHFAASWTGESFILQGFQGNPGVWSFFKLCFIASEQGIPTLRVQADTCCIYIPERDAASFRNLIELCSGLGGLALGAHQLRVRTLLSVDKSPLACEAVTLNGGRA